MQPRCRFWPRVGWEPRGIDHAYWNAGKTTAKMLITISPSGFERYFEELAEGF